MANPNLEEIIEEITLSKDELALLTNFDCLAYDMMRKERQQQNKIPPCWLCCSDEARAEARTNAMTFLRLATGRSDMTEEHAKKYITSRIPANLVQRWRDAELTYKKYRAQGNPRAFFAE
jgi:hypothetical protein